MLGQGGRGLHTLNRCTQRMRRRRRPVERGIEALDGQIRYRSLRRCQSDRLAAKSPRTEASLRAVVLQSVRGPRHLSAVLYLQAFWSSGWVRPPSGPVSREGLPAPQLPRISARLQRATLRRGNKCCPQPPLCLPTCGKREGRRSHPGWEAASGRGMWMTRGRRRWPTLIDRKKSILHISKLPPRSGSGRWTPACPGVRCISLCLGLE